MYLELRITADYGSKQEFVRKLRQEIGVNAVSASTAVQNTIFRAHAPAIVPKVIAAEQIQHKIFILYFLEGSDTIVAHVAARTVAETKQQAVRVARRTCTLFANSSTPVRTKAVIYAVDSFGLDTALITGERIGRLRRFIDAFTERWLARLVTPGLVFGVAAAYLPGSNLFVSAMIGFFAAIVTLVIESIVFISTADDWKWREVPNDE